MSTSEVVDTVPASVAAIAAADVRSGFRLVLSQGGQMTGWFGPLPTRAVAEVLRVSAGALGVIELDGASLCEVHPQVR
jgi:hypothetical protein